MAAGIGLLVVPQSLARLHHRRDLVFRPVTDAPQSQVALSWLEDRTSDLVEEFIGIVRGRTVNSSRGRAETPPQPKQQRPAAAKGKAKPKPKANPKAKTASRGKPRRRS